MSQRRQVLPLQLVGELFPVPNYSFCPFYLPPPPSLLAFPTASIAHPDGGEGSAGRAFSHLHLQLIPNQDLQQKIPPQSIFPLPALGFFSRCFLKLRVETAGVIRTQCKTAEYPALCFLQAFLRCLPRLPGVASPTRPFPRPFSLPSAPAMTHFLHLFPSNKAVFSQ